MVGDFVGLAASFLSLRDSSYWWKEFRAGEVVVKLRKNLSQEQRVSAYLDCFLWFCVQLEGFFSFLFSLDTFHFILWHRIYVMFLYFVYFKEEIFSL